MSPTPPVCDLILAGGRVIDPANGFDGTADVAIGGGRITAVGQNLPRPLGASIRDVRGLIVAPGLIDLHVHVYEKGTSYGVSPDRLARRGGAATLVDAGSAGPGNFAGFRDFVIRSARVRILAYLNIAFPGIFAFGQDWVVGEAQDASLLRVDDCVAVARENRDIVIGIKVRIGGPTSGELGLGAVDLAIAAAERLNLPVMAHIGRPPPSYQDLVARLRPGDVLTHCYRPAPNAPVSDTGRVLDALWKARERGVLFDVGHGAGAFGFDSAEAAIAQGFLPDIVSSDAHAFCIHGPAFDLLHTMSKLMACGVPLEAVIAMATAAPARAIGRGDLARLAAGAPADVTLIEIVETETAFRDVTGLVRTGVRRLTVRGLMLGGEEVATAACDFEESPA